MDMDKKFSADDDFSLDDDFEPKSGAPAESASAAAQAPAAPIPPAFEDFVFDDELPKIQLRKKKRGIRLNKTASEEDEQESEPMPAAEQESEPVPAAPEWTSEPAPAAPEWSSEPVPAASADEHEPEPEAPAAPAAEKPQPEKRRAPAEKKPKAEKPAAAKREKGKSKDKTPTKNSINLIVKEKNDIRPEFFVAALVVIAVVALLIGKFAVVDLLTALNNAQGEVSSVQSQIDADYAEMASYGDLDDRYAHYTFSGMNETELTTVSREEVLDLLREKVMPYAEVGSWSVLYNTVTLPVVDSSLQDVNLIVQQLNADERVEYCTVRTAESDTDVVTYVDSDGVQVVDENSENTVTAQITIYLTSVVKGAFGE